MYVKKKRKKKERKELRYSKSPGWAVVYSSVESPHTVNWISVVQLVPRYCSVENSVPQCPFICFFNGTKASVFERLGRSSSSSAEVYFSFDRLIDWGDVGLVDGGTLWCARSNAAAPSLMVLKWYSNGPLVRKDADFESRQIIVVFERVPDFNR